MFLNGLCDARFEDDESWKQKSASGKKGQKLFFCFFLPFLPFLLPAFAP
jgi:hypothetical protein